MNIWYEAYIRPFYHYKGKDMKMSNKFKVGDLVFEIDVRNGVELTTLSATDNDTFSIRGSRTRYLSDGRGGPYAAIPSLLHATPENRQALVALYGEDAVPELPPSPQEVMLKLLENQKYQLCRVSNHSTEWENNNNLKAVVHIGVFGKFLDSNGEWWTYGIPVDNNGDEITEIEK